MGIWDAPPLPRAAISPAPPPPPTVVVPATTSRVPAPAGIDFTDEARLIRLARELAMEMRATDAILADYGVGTHEWESLSRSPRFQSLLVTEMAQWNAAQSTHDRVRLKSAVLVEEYLVEANRRLHDINETLSSKVELFKTLARIANLGTGDGEGGSGGGFRVVINIAGAPTVTRTLNAPREVQSETEDVALEREHAIRKEAERTNGGLDELGRASHDSVVLPGTRITVRPSQAGAGMAEGAGQGLRAQVEPLPPERMQAAGRPGQPPMERPPRELSAYALKSPARR